MGEFHGKRRIFKAYLSISASGPEPGIVRSSSIGTRRSRDGADLAFTTSDCDWFVAHLREPNYDTGEEEHFERLVNPTLPQVLSAIERAGQFLSSHVVDARWDGGQFTVIYAGHGAEESGAWVLEQDHLSAISFAEALLNSVDVTTRHLRLDLIMDSCFAGAFLADLLEYSWNREDQRLFVCDAFGACLADELAWELDERGHGAFTFAFKAMFGPGIQDPDRLRSGGVSWLTNGEQHAFEYTNGHLEVIGGGSIELYGGVEVRSSSLRLAMNQARNVPPEVDVPLH
jgi:hypothetical protein